MASAPRALPPPLWGLRVGPPRGAVGGFDFWRPAGRNFPPIVVLYVAPPAVAGARISFAGVVCGTAAQPRRRPKIWGLHTVVAGVAGMCVASLALAPLALYWQRQTHGLVAALLSRATARVAARQRSGGGSPPFADSPSRRLAGETAWGGHLQGFGRRLTSPPQPFTSVALSSRRTSPAPLTYHTLQVWLFGRGGASPVVRCTRPCLALGRHFGGGGGCLRHVARHCSPPLGSPSVCALSAPPQGALLFWRPLWSCYSVAQHIRVPRMLPHQPGSTAGRKRPSLGVVLTGASHPPSPPVPGGCRLQARFHRAVVFHKKKRTKRKRGAVSSSRPAFLLYITFLF